MDKTEHITLETIDIDHETFLPLAMEVTDDQGRAIELIATIASIMHSLIKLGVKMDLVSLLFDERVRDKIHENDAATPVDMIDLSHDFLQSGVEND